MEKLWSLLQKKIEMAYGIAEPEWVQVEVSRRGKIHVTIVSDKKFSKEDICDLIRDELKQYSGYSVGFINIYPLQLAAELNIEKKTKNQKLYSWADGLNADTRADDKDTNLNIISFYSYKGGVGRTVALIETAYNLAKEGKRVLLLDLDIEAPSLHNLFSKNVNDEVSGIEYGIVEYLYRMVVQGRTDVSLSDIYCPLQLNDVEGAMFLIPALKDMNKDYIYQIGRLQTEQIHDKDIFSKLFQEIEDELGVDIILIDTRAGFNPWGSLSLFSLSNQIIFVAYPNAENVEGLNVAFKMLENMGKKRYAVAMSKVVSSNDGLEKALELFEELHISQDLLIPIYYQEEIALNNAYPIVANKIVAAYSELSNYILDSERIALNRQYLAGNKKFDMLKQISFDGQKRIILTGIRRFMRQSMQTLLVYRFEEELYGLGNSVVRGRKAEGDFFLPFHTYTFFDRENEGSYRNILANTELSFEQQGIELIRTAVSACSEEWADIFSRANEWKDIRDIEEDLKETVREDEVMYLESGENVKSIAGIQVCSRIRVVINLTDTIMEWDYKRIRDSVLGLVAAYKNIEFVQFKFVMKYSLWKKLQEDFAGLKAGTTEVNIFPEDILRTVFKNLNQELFIPYLSMAKANDAYKKFNSWNLRDDHTITLPQMMEVFELLLGIRKDVRTYSSSVYDYVNSFLNDNKQICYTKLLEAIRTALQMELEGEQQTRADDRLISFENLQCALESLKE